MEPKHDFVFAFFNHDGRPLTLSIANPESIQPTRPRWASKECSRYIENVASKKKFGIWFLLQIQIQILAIVVARPAAEKWLSYDMYECRHR